MKAVDTPVLLAFLRGSEKARALFRSLRGEEIATTELNLYELEALARLDPKVGRERRLAALDRLRRKLTVLTVDEQSVKAGVRHLRAHPRSAACPLIDLMIGSLEANGCAEWITSSPAPRGRLLKFKWRVVDVA